MRYMNPNRLLMVVKSLYFHGLALPIDIIAAATEAGYNLETISPANMYPKADLASLLADHGVDIEETDEDQLELNFQSRDFTDEEVEALDNTP